MGLTLGYLYLLLLIHVPGAIVHALPWSRLSQPELTAVGIQLTAFGCLAYVAGVWLGRLGRPAVRFAPSEIGIQPRFLRFCVASGWFAAFVLLPLVGRTPSLRALVDEGAMIWMIGVMLGLAKALRERNGKAFLMWLTILAVYPALVLLKAGFLSFGINAAIMCLMPLVLVARTTWRAWTGVIVITVLGLGLFATYLPLRKEIRELIREDQDMEKRVERSSRIVREFKLLDVQDKETLSNVNDRLNQNYFVGLAYTRLQRGIVDYYRGRTVVEAALAVIPRALWPEKPVYGGSPEIIQTMTGFVVREGTSYGVGNVMEFYINFGLPSLLGGFVLIGWLLGRWDWAAAQAMAAGDLKKVVMLVLPAISFIQPDKSVVEMCGGTAAAFAAAWVWCKLWKFWSVAKG